MKTCPICKARCFDDMEICYGCMHPFETDENAGAVPAAEEGFDSRQSSDSVASPDADFVGEHRKDSEKTKAPRRKPLRVYGAMGESDRPWWEEQAAVLDEESSSGYFAGGMSESMPMLEPVEGPLAMASMGNGYRLVLAIERE